MNRFKEISETLHYLRLEAAKCCMKIRLIQLKQDDINTIKTWYKENEIPFEGRYLGFDIVPFYEEEK